MSIADIYHALAARYGLSHREIDGLTLRQIAVMLDVELPAQAPEPPSP